MVGVDEAVPRALHALLGDDWRERLKQAVARQMAPASPASPASREPKKRALTDAQREARRASMLAINAARAAARARPPAPAEPASVRAIVTRKANQAAREAADTSDPGLNAEELHEARAMLAKGKGALDLREWFGGGLGWWQAWCERERKAA